MTAEQFAALKPGDRVIVLAEGGAIGSCVVYLFGLWQVQCNGVLAGCRPDEIDLPDTETPPLFEEDGA